MDGMRDSTTYLLGLASTRGALETRQFLTRNAVPFKWVDVENDPLVQLLQGDAQLTGRRYPLALFADGSILEAPERFMRRRYVRATPTDTPSPYPRRTSAPTPRPPSSSNGSRSGSACPPGRHGRSTTWWSSAPVQPG
jgi:hypothetical protein